MVGIVRNDLLPEVRNVVTIPDAHVIWLKFNRGFFLADPHWLDESKRMIICECLYFHEKIGKLAIVFLNEDWSIREMKMINSKSKHYSYPQVIRINGKCFIIPESAFDNCIKMLEIDENENKIVREQILIENCNLVDPTVFYHNQKYWMFANPLNDFNHQLEIFYADTIEGPWTRTSYSPLTIQNCRGAGTVIFENGQMFWFTQYNEKQYGGGIIRRRIIKLDENEFIFETEGRIMPDEQSKYPFGLHTMNIGRSNTLIDGKNYSFQIIKPFRALYFRLFRKRG